MATTTNYSWTTPDDTALVKDGAAAIRSLGTAIDTTVFTNAGAAIAKTIVDAKGDIIAATAADTVSRLAVGANNTVLTADSSTATGLKWAPPADAGLVFITSSSFSAVSSVSVNNCFTGTYKSYRVIINALSSANTTAKLRYRASGTDNSDAQYQQADFRISSGNTTAQTWGGLTANQIELTNTKTNLPHFLILDISYPATTDPTRAILNGQVSWNGVSDCELMLSGTRHNVASAFDGFSYFMGSGTTTGTVEIYGYRS
jgi:hypothetical protein